MSLRRGALNARTIGMSVMSAFQISDNDYPRWEHLPMEHALLDGLIETDYGQFDLLCGVTIRCSA